MIEREVNVGGCVTYWSLGTWSHLGRLTDALGAAGFADHAPAPRTAPACLRDALEHVYKDACNLIRPLKTRDGFHVVREHRGELLNDYRGVVTAKIDPATLEVDFTPAAPEAQAVVDAYNRYRGYVRAANVADALVKAAERLGGVRLRPTGGLYWLPDARLGDWLKVARAVEDAAELEAGDRVGRNAVYVLRNVMDDGALRAVRDAVVAEVSAEAERIDKEVMEGKLGERALAARAEQAEALRAKIRQFEELLGVGLAQLHDAVDKAEQAAGKALLLASVPAELEVA